MQIERRESPLRGDQVVVRAVDAEIAALAAAQHGVVATRQLAALGLGKRGAAARAAAGRLHPILTANGHRMAAVLACGNGAALSHASAAALWEIRPTNATRIDVTVPSSGGRAKRPRIRIHRAASLQATEVKVHQGIRVTTPARTLLDLAAQLPRRALERALDQAVINELFDLTALDAVVRAHPSERGAARLAQTLAQHHAGTTPTKSELEELMLAICDDHGLPRPLVNAYLGEDRVDFLFPAHRLVVEADSWRYHRTRHRFERDRRRDAAHTLAGYRTLRFTDRQLTRQPGAVADAIAAVLADRPAA
jgi:hypothetical protein